MKKNRHYAYIQQEEEEEVLFGYYAVHEIHVVVYEQIHSLVITFNNFQTLHVCLYFGDDMKKR